MSGSALIHASRSLFRSTKSFNWSCLIPALRPRQWIKNAFVFAAPFFAYETELRSLLLAAGAFFVFCAVSSGSYLINDIFDLDEDRLHSVKKDRSLASGRVSTVQAWFMASLLLIFGLASSLIIDLWLGFVIVAYMLLQLAYNLILREIVIVDIVALAAGFVLRALAGGVVARLSISPWFLSCVALLAFYVGLQKRKAELIRVGETGILTRKVLSNYSLSYLRRVEIVMLMSLLITYGLWAIQGAPTAWMVITIPFVVCSVFRYRYLINTGIGEEPGEILFADRPIRLNIFFWLLSCFAILTLNHANAV